jgi:hypothetical protein
VFPKFHRNGEGYFHAIVDIAWQGYQAGRAAERAEIVAKLESEEALKSAAVGVYSVNYFKPETDNPSVADLHGSLSWRRAKAAITKILEVIC